ncbi:MAG: DUF5011 domain-containing protein [Candidatus Hydrogenedens sp.]|nr:DUF5011 domain-containing protein [Candidatus Hydrogenedens sp.]
MECSRNFSRRGPTIRLWAVAAVAVLVCGLAVAESPQVFYPFNGNANDLSGRTGRNGTLQGAPTLGADRNSVANQAYSFNGTSQYVTTPYQQGSGITAYSISAWFRSNSADTNGRTIVSARGADADRSLTLSMGTGFGVPAGRIFFGLDTSGVGFGVYTNTAYNDNNWHHVVGIFSRASGTIVNGDFTIYVDGAQAATTTVSVGSPGTAPITNTSTTTIGRQMQWASSYWNGGLDDIGIYARVLSAGDIACLYSATAAMKSTWDFNGAGNVEGWTAMNQIASGPTQSGGQMQYTTAAAASDPMIGSPMMALPRAQGSWLKVRAQNGTTATGAILFWDSDLVADFTGGHQGNYPINPGDTQVSEYWLNLATTGANWTGTTYIQQFRFDFPDNGGSLTGPVNVDQIAILSSGPPAPTVAAVTRQNPVTATWTNASQVTWDVRFSHSMTTVAGNDFAVTATGTAAGTGLNVTRMGPTWYRVTADVSGQGTLRLDAATGGSGRDVADQALASAFTGGEVYQVDRSGPSVTIGAPSATLATSGPVTYTVDYADAGSGIAGITLVTGNITLNKTGTADGTVGVSGSGNSRTVTISGITGSGTLGISIAAGTATDNIPNAAAAAGPSATFNVDNDPPVITRNGPASVVLECGATYADTGATALDNLDGNITANIAVDGLPPAGPLAPGEWTITYNVGDTAGNQATEVTRSVTVSDTLAPLVTITGGTLFGGECGVALTLPGATALDGCSGALSVDITDLDGLDPSNPARGVYAVVYTSAEDGAGLSDTEVLVVNIADSVAPVVTVTGGNTLEGECGVALTLPGATVVEGCAAGLAATVTDYDGLDPAHPAKGVYNVVYGATDGAGLEGTDVLVVTITDTADPVVTIPGPNPINTFRGFPFTPPEVTAQDACDGALAVTPSGSVDMGTPGQYTLTYTAEDAEGNTAQEELVVNVSNDLPPVITLLGDASMTLDCGDTYTDAGATAADIEDGDLTGDIVVAGLPPAGMLAPGAWTVTYNVSDSILNAAQTVTRTVTVLEN